MFIRQFSPKITTVSAVAGAIAFLLLFLILLTACGSSSNAPAGPAATDPVYGFVTPTVTNAVTPSPTTVGPLHVAGVVVSVNPASFSAITCGATATLTFTAVISVSGSTGGTVNYTWNTAGTARSTSSVTFNPGQASASVTYTVINTIGPSSASAVSSSISTSVNGNAVASPAIAPAGSCTYTGALHVNSIAMAVSPASITGYACGTSLHVTYTATITIAPASNGGTVTLKWVFSSYTTTVSVAFPSYTTGQVTRSVAVTLSGKLAKGGKFPSAGSITSLTPNVVTSAAVGPVGACH